MNSLVEPCCCNVVSCVLSPGCGGEGWLDILLYSCLSMFFLWGGSGGGQGFPDPPGKSQVAIGFLKSTGTDPPREAIGP